MNNLPQEGKKKYVKPVLVKNDPLTDITFVSPDSPPDSSQNKNGNTIGKDVEGK